MTIQDDLNAITSTLASIKTVKAAPATATPPGLTAILTNLISLFNSNAPKAKITPVFTQYVTQFNVLTTLTDALSTQGAKLSADYAATLPAPIPAPTPTTTPTPTQTPSTGAQGFLPLKLGGGGFVTGLDISKDGTTRVIRTDVGGGYIWNSVADKWQQLITPERGFSTFSGLWEIRVAPNTPTVIYLVLEGDVWKSVNRGATFSKLTGWTNRSMNSNDTSNSSRVINPKMAIDPLDANHVILHTYTDGMWRTTDGGVSWSLTSLPPGTTAGAVKFFAGSAAVNGRTGTIYASTYGHGLYKSIDGGATWAAVAGGPGAAGAFFTFDVAADGAVYTMGDPNKPPYSPALNRLIGSTWATITPSAQQWDALACDPNNAARLLYFKGGGGPSGQAAFSSNANTTATFTNVSARTLDTTGDVTWLGWTNENYMSSAGFTFDPVVPGRVWFAQGIGVWYADMGTGTPSSVDWKCQSRGIEELVVNQIVKVPGGPALVAVWDRQLFRQTSPDTYPSRHYPDADFTACWSIDYLASNPNLVVCTNQWNGDWSFKSTDAGATNAAMTGLRTAIVADGGSTGSYYGGHICVASATNYIYVPAVDNAINPHVTKDGGATWKPLTSFPGAPGKTGWGVGQWSKRHICDADEINNKIYLYNYLKGLYVSSDQGDTWTLVNPNINLGALGSNATAYHAKLRAIPGKQNELMFTSGADGQAAPFIRSTDGGANFSVVNAKLQNVYAFGFGKAATGQSYPAIFAYGELSGAYGVYRSDDNGASWQTVPGYSWLDTVTTVEGDPEIYGRVYVGHSGTGALYYPG